ncbi:hypothetical protein [Niveibacterium sp. SC-1]|uniref:hypothetical protein n=1 Tax=Niveibacterium sp. SC-1 TaxID=3135646 RepID=UPI00311EF874
MDDMDRTQQLCETMLDRQLGAAREYRPAVQAMGACHNCGECLAEGKRWCDADCRNDWQARQHMAVAA